MQDAAAAAPHCTVELLSKAEKQLSALYDIHDFLFLQKQSEKQKLLEDGVAAVLATLETAGEGYTGKEKARLAYIKGRALDAYSAYSSEAEACLSRAVKLQPNDQDAWNALAHCYWKKRDFKAAQNCYLEALSKGDNVKSLRQLSMLLLQLFGLLLLSLAAAAAVAVGAAVSACASAAASSAAAAASALLPPAVQRSVVSHPLARH